MNIPETAIEIFRKEGISIKGDKVKYIQWEGYASQGFKSKYDKVKTRYACLWINGVVFATKQYSGRNIQIAQEEIATIQQMVN